eukprot:TRINITY_DN110496_c0_g1_i1.p1 TRINITY_DN110496_c0_g1~~TRINITY_DN110496_c0_g1_i1.p1  ORF type:complete len:373 (+),score=89.76 TRINITY_DN110496_c0_g1_i1:79-1197(+)
MYGKSPGDRFGGVRSQPYGGGFGGGLGGGLSGGGLGGFGGGMGGGMSGETCQFFQRAGWCKYGDTCRFAHIGGGGKGGSLGVPGAPSMPSVPAGRKTGEICMFFQKNGWCKYGDSCGHEHIPTAETPLGVSPDGVTGPRTGETCSFFVKNGWCKYGDACRHDHIPGPDTPMGVLSPGEQGEVCSFFQKAGWCQYGDICRYLHTPGPDTPIGVQGKGGGKGGGKGKGAMASGEVCQFFSKAGWCQYGNDCRFAHIPGGGDGSFGGGGKGSFGGGGKGGFGGGKGAALPLNDAPLSPAEYEAAAAALINTSGMKRAEAVGLQLTDDAVQNLLKLPAQFASELLEAVAEKHATLRDPSNYVISTIARGYMPRSGM